MKVESIQKTSTPELVVRELLRNIRSGELKPGDKLPPERELSKAFGVGRSSIREAVSAMVLVGYFEVTQGKGIFLKEDIPSPYVFNSRLSDILDAYWILDVLEAREHIECSVVRLAGSKAGPDEIGRLRAMVAGIQAARTDIEAFYRADFAFHMAIAETADNSVLTEILKMIIEKVHACYTRFIPQTLCRPDHAVATAGAVVDRIADGRPEAACRQMVAHLGIVKSELARIIPEAGRGRETVSHFRF